MVGHHVVLASLLEVVDLSCQVVGHALESSALLSLALLDPVLLDLVLLDPVLLGLDLALVHETLEEDLC